eukprot:gene13346-14723_t
MFGRGARKRPSAVGGGGGQGVARGQVVKIEKYEKVELKYPAKRKQDKQEQEQEQEQEQKVLEVKCPKLSMSVLSLEDQQEFFRLQKEREEEEEKAEEKEEQEKAEEEEEQEQAIGSDPVGFQWPTTPMSYTPRGMQLLPPG